MPTLPLRRTKNPSTGMQPRLKPPAFIYLLTDTMLRRNKTFPRIRTLRFTTRMSIYTSTCTITNDPSRATTMRSSTHMSTSLRTPMCLIRTPKTAADKRITPGPSLKPGWRSCNTMQRKERSALRHCRKRRMTQDLTRFLASMQDGRSFSMLPFWHSSLGMTDFSAQCCAPILIIPCGSWWIAGLILHRYDRGWIVPFLFWLCVTLRIVTLYLPVSLVMTPAKAAWGHTAVRAHDSIPAKFRKPIAAAVTLSVMLIGAFVSEESADNTRANRAVSLFGLAVMVAVLYATSRNRTKVRRAPMHTHRITCS